MVLKKLFTIFLQKLWILSAISIRLTKLTGKSNYYIHPKHLIKKRPWYLKFLSKKDIVLDMGCALGQHSIDASKKVKRVIAFDIHEEIIKIARKRAEDVKRKNIKFELIDGEKTLPYKDNSFTAVLCLDVLEHLKNEALAMKEIRRILKPNSKLFLSLPNKETSWKQFQKKAGLFYYSDPDHKREYTKKDVENLCGRYKFEVKFIEPVVIDTPLAPVIDLIGGFSLTLYQKLVDWKRKKAKEHPFESVGFQVYAINQKPLEI